jgi:S-adenosyl-L-methionine hydrolase (adenosine-forming)
MKRPLITLLTDFGTADHYAASMKGVILGICPGADLIDISHEVTPFSIAEGAYTLAQAWGCFPPGTTHLAVVDPGVGSPRRPIVAEVAGHRFVAPDNGLLSMVLSGAKVRQIDSARYFRHPVSKTFHGRDIFARVAAHLAKGLPAAKLGKLISDPVLGDFTKPTQLNPGRWTGHVLKIDRFGNIVTNLEWATFQDIAKAPFKLKLGRRTVTSYYATYAEAPAGELFAINGSSGYVEVSLNQSNAALALGAKPGAPVSIYAK